MRAPASMLVVLMSACHAAAPASAFHEVAPAALRIEECLKTTHAALGGDVLHAEYESRDGRPTYEFIIKGKNETYYVGCDATSGLLREVDILVSMQDPRWTSIAKIDEAAARVAATERYKGKIEEVKRLLLADGSAVYEVDVEVEGAAGEFNVYVDAVTGKIVRVNIEYWEIGGSAR
jgi:uncharacterized membrane protein YkoI